MSEGTKRRLAAIVSADVVGNSRLMGADEAGTLSDNPTLSLQAYAEWVPLKNQADLDHVRDGMRKAGFPE